MGGAFLSLFDVDEDAVMAGLGIFTVGAASFMFRRAVE